MNLYNKDADNDDFSDQEEDDDDHSPQDMRLKNLMVPNRQFHHDGQQDYATQFQKYKGKKNKFQFNSQQYNSSQDGITNDGTKLSYFNDSESAKPLEVGSNSYSPIHNACPTAEFQVKDVFVSQNILSSVDGNMP